MNSNFFSPKQIHLMALPVPESQVDLELVQGLTKLRLDTAEDECRNCRLHCAADNRGGCIVCHSRRGES